MVNPEYRLYLFTLYSVKQLVCWLHLYKDIQID